MQSPAFTYLPTEEDDGREVFDGNLHRKPPASNAAAASQTKVYPTEAQAAKKSPNTKASPHRPVTTQRATQPHTPQSIFFLILIAVSGCTSLGWTLWLILLNVAPNDTVNRVMNTENFDYGSFWLLVDPSKAMVGVETFGLSVVALGYVGVLVKMLPCIRRSRQSYLVHRVTNRSLRDKVEKALNDAADSSRRSRLASSAARLAVSLTHEDSPTRKITVWYKSLYQALTIYCACRFDFLIIVGCPMLVVFYCLSSFTFNRAQFPINLKVFPAGWFEQGASVIADAEQTAVIYESLKSLRIMTALSFFTRIGVNLTLCIRLWKVVDLIHDPKKRCTSVYPKRHRFGAIVLLIYAALLIVFVEESMRTSALACEPHPECVVKARRWTILEDESLTQCPCLMLIDRDTAPKTYAEWESPRNVTDKVAQLATMGELQTIQLTNRYLPVLPDELRGCKNLEASVRSLEYTHTQTFPMWVKEFTKLEYLHVESKFTSPMVVLPDDMFEDMSALTFIHFAAFIPMAKLPSFDGLTNLKSLTLAVFLFLEEVPSFDHLQNLERIVLSCVTAIDSVPDFSQIKNLKSFAVSDRGAWCCNGFLGQCDLANPNCGVHPLWGSPVVSCTDKRASAATLAAVEKFDATTCGPVLQPGVLEDLTSWPRAMAQCGSSALQWTTSSRCATTRDSWQLLIAQGVGDPCDPKEEAWLGCKDS
ncbi:hypothetical protein PHYSODRAFT_295536 [Phytophthora sojae]|uniref:WLGC domain-containing protein n=1 Tax=Phytophthora sojae (strain P6497) TaxID=1094619 RepID=G4YRU7_PHYSP|nr:hypothetical protein PHYSODRAFT_295536 [Phytophthora sojae]EGZ22924.1 hypothetical protein PHYSODRAFT_295536 [Phytophthora sojae]|eukprot:XP_009518212.1 hypothetical protein PHYSODRAFT_295536 [Phytophthora sojae]